MKKKISLVLATVMMVVIFGCAAHTHVIGNGAKGGEVVTQKQWYAVFGLVPMGMVDTKAMAGSATDYTIRTESSFLDAIISAFTGVVTISCRTVKVEK